MELNASCAYGHSSRVFDLAFHPADPGILASVCEDGNARVWSYSPSEDAWEQVTCCSGHTSEALRVAWSPDGTRLATGGADGCVKLWRTPPTASGCSSSNGFTNTYGAEELACFGDHPEEVYALEFLPDHSSQCDTSTSTQTGSSGGANWLVAGSGQSLFLWDLSAGQLVHEATPPAARSVDPSQPAKGPDGAFPPYVFGLARQRGTNILATACCDGGVRLWRAAGGRLELAGEVQAHIGDIGTACLFSPTHPNLMACVSKGGELTWVDIRRLTSNSRNGSGGGSLAPASKTAGAAAAAVVSRQRLAGPVFACALVPADGFGGGGERLAVVGVDHAVRLYDVSAAGTEPLDNPMGLVMPGGYCGRLLTVTVSSDGTRIAAAGEPVPSEELQPLSTGRQGSGGGAPAGQLAPPAAAAVAGAAVGRRRRRGGGSSAVIGLGSLAGGSGDDDSMFEQLSLDDGGGDGRGALDRPAASHEGVDHDPAGGSGLVRAPLYVFEVLQVLADEG